MKDLEMTVTEQRQEDKRMAIRRRLSEERLRRAEERDRRLAETKRSRELSRGMEWR